MNLSTRQGLIDYLKQNQIWLKKDFGQHFLIEPEYIVEMIEAAKLKENSHVVEVGPGLGILTAALSDKLTNGKVLALEADFSLVEKLREGIGRRKNVSVLHVNALQFDWPSLSQEFVSYQIVANLPYQITSPLLHLLLIKVENPPERITIMVQKEVAERLTSPPGHRTRGLTTVMTELVGQARIVATLPPTAFFPPPRVESAILDIVLNPRQGDEAAILKIAKAGFSNKRRTLSNSLSGSLRLPKNQVNAILQQADIDPGQRAEELTVEQWRKLTGVINEFLSEYNEE